MRFPGSKEEALDASGVIRARERKVRGKSLRNISVSEEEFARNWEIAFGKKKPKTISAD